MSFLKQQCTNHEVRDGIYAMPYMITCVARPIPIGTYSKRTIYSQLLARLNISRPNIMKSRNETEKKLEKRENGSKQKNTHGVDKIHWKWLWKVDENIFFFTGNAGIPNMQWEFRIEQQQTGRAKVFAIISFVCTLNDAWDNNQTRLLLAMATDLA